MRPTAAQIWSAVSFDPDQPAAGATVALREIWIVLAGTSHPQSTILLATHGIALAFLGPGCLSIDARVFGGKRLNIRVLAC